jgi:glycerophosphoryl diester phosphodiesterase
MLFKLALLLHLLPLSRQGAMRLSILTLLSLLTAFPVMAQRKPIIIAHRGASGYLPEHTLAAKALAYGMGTDYIEQDVVLTADNIPIVLHDIHLDTVTDVKDKYPDRAREDGRFYALDFTLSEIKSLRVHERINMGSGQPVFLNRFPLGRSTFTVPTLAEEIELIQGLNQSTGKNVGIYPEIKYPAWHREQGKDISVIVLKTLTAYGYTDENSKIYLQCFDPEEIKRIRYELHARIKLVQLLGGPVEKMVTPEGLEALAGYVQGIGPSVWHLVTGKNNEGHFNITAITENAHAAGLLVHPYTFRIDGLPSYIENYDELLQLFYLRLGVDGVFTDFPDRTLDFLKKNNLR